MRKPSKKTNIIADNKTRIAEGKTTKKSKQE